MVGTSIPGRANLELQGLFTHRSLATRCVSVRATPTLCARLRIPKQVLREPMPPWELPTLDPGTVGEPPAAGHVSSDKQRQPKGAAKPMSTNDTPRSGLAVGFIVFAGVTMIMIGALQAIQGLVALFNDDFYVVGQKWVFEFDLTTWGWIHLLVGVSCWSPGSSSSRAPSGLGSGHRGRRDQRRAELHVAAYYPIWSLIIIALDVFVIWALSVHGRDVSR